ncbi:MAG: DUF3592 domain-containing protein [Arhodomonas sp.]|nr:DUF3592 domain-containing protein [Arhodomonas sp.]
MLFPRGGGGLLYRTARFLWKLFGVQRLVRVEGTVKDADVVHSVEIGMSGTPDMYKPEIKYEYQHRGVRYVSHQYGFLDSARWYYNKDDALSQLPESNTSVAVYVHPKDPEIAYINPRVDWKCIAYAIRHALIAVTAIGVGFVLLVEGWQGH